MIKYGMMFFYQSLKKGKCFDMRYLFIIIVFLTLNTSSDTLYYFENEIDENRFNNLIKDIRCPKCTSGSLSSSNAPISEDLKIRIAEMINENKTDQEIKDYVSSRFGQDSLYEPELNSKTYILWYSPFAFLLLAFLIFFFRKK